MYTKNSLEDYPRPSVTTDAVVFTLREGRLSLLLIRRGHDPYAGQWALPGGFISPNETLDECARRELVEETGVDLNMLRHFANYSTPGRDPRGWVITAAYLALTPVDDLKPVADTDAAEVDWFGIDDLPSLAFDHADIVSDGLAALRKSCQDYRPLFALLPDSFTFAEFHAAHDLVMGRESDRRNLHKLLMASGLIEETGELQRGSHRPARLYRMTETAKS